MTSAMELWKAENGGSTGEGIVVAVIDSGINYTHPDMQMRQDARLKYTKADMEAKIAALGYGKYYTDKVPFGFSYVDEDDINNRQVTHGLHVSASWLPTATRKTAAWRALPPTPSSLPCRCSAVPAADLTTISSAPWRIP